MDPSQGKAKGLIEKCFKIILKFIILKYYYKNIIFKIKILEFTFLNIFKKKLD